MKTITQLFLLIACASITFAAAIIDDVHQKDESDVHEAVCRYLFDHNTSTLQKRAKAYYLAVGEKKGADPADEFLKRFADHKPPVLKRSAAAISPDKGVTDKQTGERGLIFRLYGIKWISEGEAELRGGCYEAGNDSLVNTYTIKKDNGKWKITKVAEFRKA